NFVFLFLLKKSKYPGANIALPSHLYIFPGKKLSIVSSLSPSSPINISNCPFQFSNISYSRGLNISTSGGTYGIFIIYSLLSTEKYISIPVII
ncbi:hypothetical protein, partial [Cetobacterium somerae]|uniref:hypothetical protein n=1 Tax=Cetobacterium somerae TaxID=188913 RepID=UPI00211F35BC